MKKRRDIKGKSVSKIYDGQIGVATKELPERYKRVNIPLKFSDVVYAAILMANLYIFLPLSDGEKERTTFSENSLNTLWMAGVAGISAVVVTVRSKGHVSGALITSVSVCFMFSVLWLFAVLYEVSTRLEDAKELSCHLGYYSVLPRYGMISTATFVLVLFLSSSLY